MCTLMTMNFAVEGHGKDRIMSKSEIIKWLQNLKKDIGQSQHQDLWHYAEILDEVIGKIEVSEEEIKGCDKVGKRFSEDAISRKAVGEMLMDSWVDGFEYSGDLIGDLAKIPSVIPKPKVSEWIPRYHQGVDKLICECSNCHTLHAISNFCPNCGAKMKGADDER